MKLRERIAKFFLGIFLVLTIHGFAPHIHHEYADDECQLASVLEDHEHGHHHHHALDFLHILLEFHSHTDFENSEDDLWLFAKIITVDQQPLKSLPVPDLIELTAESGIFNDPLISTDHYFEENPLRGPPTLV